MAVTTPDLSLLADKLHRLGWTVREESGMFLARKVAILSRWWFGKRQIDQSLRLALDHKAKVMTLAESAIEVCVGIPPLTISNASTRQSGLHVTEDRTDRGWGGGSMHYGEARRLVEEECARAGWTLHVTSLMR